MGSLLRTASGSLQRQRSLLAVIACVFIASRIFYWFLGIRFDAEPLQFYWQYIDPALLQHDFWRSIFYLEQQPPAFNFFLGTILHVAPEHPEIAFHSIYLCLGLALSLSLFALMERLGVNLRIAFTITVAFTLSPSTLLYENLLFYEYPLAALLCVSALFLHRYAAEGRIRDGLIFFSCLAWISGIRAVYHLAWFGILAISTLVALGRWKKQTILALAAPASVILVFYAKHFIVFHNLVPGGGVHGAINLSRMTSGPLSPDRLDRLIASGKISPILKTDLFHFARDFDTEPAGDQLATIVPVPPKTGIPVLDECEKSTEALNWNCAWAEDIATLSGKDSLVVLRAYPKAYLQSVSNNIPRYFLPDTEEWPFDGRTDVENLQILARPLAFYNLLTTGEWPPKWDQPWLFYMALPLLIAFGLFKVIRGFRDAVRDQRRVHDPAFITLTFLFFNVVYLTVVVLLLSVGDQNRYRSEVSPYFAVLLGALITSWVNRILAGTSGRGAEQ
jgi:hypothetical protein